MNTLTATALDVALEASRKGVVQLGPNWYACGLRHATYAEAEETFRRFDDQTRQAREKNEDRRRPRIGSSCADGIIYATHITDGELTCDLAKLRYERPKRSGYDKRGPIAGVIVAYDQTVLACHQNEHAADLAIREICRFISNLKTRSVDSHERELFDIVRALADRNGLLTANPWVGQPRGEASTAPVGALTAESVLLGVGQWVQSHADLDRDDDQPTDGGLTIAFDAGQRVYACIGGPGKGGSEMVPRLLPERAIHLCADGVCPKCPVTVRNEPRRHFRSIAYWLGRGSGPLSVADYRSINTATTVLEVVL
jgi:hypothetical protein